MDLGIECGNFIYISGQRQLKFQLEEQVEFRLIIGGYEQFIGQGRDELVYKFGLLKERMFYFVRDAIVKMCGQKDVRVFINSRIIKNS